MRQLKHSRLNAYTWTLPERARRCHASSPLPGFRGGARPLNGSILVRHRTSKAHRRSRCAIGDIRNDHPPGTLERGMRQARDAQTVTNTPHGSLRCGQAQTCRCATRSAFSRHSCADDYPVSARMPRKGERLHAKCLTHKPLPGKGSGACRSAYPTACQPSGMQRFSTRHLCDATRTIVFRYPCNLFAVPNFFVRT